MDQNLIEKQCRVCQEVKPISEYYKVSSNKSGYENRCKSCNIAAQKLWANNNKEKRNAIEKKYRSKPEVIRRRVLQQYGIDETIFQELLAKQKNMCKICEKEFTSMAHVDHCHTTGIVRGLLCGKCNRGLGMYDDDPNLLRKAADYLDDNAADSYGLARLVRNKHDFEYEKEVYDKLTLPGK